MKIFKVILKGNKNNEEYLVGTNSMSDVNWILAERLRPNKDEYDAPENEELRNHINNDIISISLLHDNVIN